MRICKVAIIGLGEAGRAFHAAVASDAHFELVAVADTEPEKLRYFPPDCSARVFGDYRSLIVETANAGLDAIIITLDPARSIEFVQLAAERGIHVMHTPPPARTVDEARRLAGTFEKSEATLYVPNSWPELETFVLPDDLGEIRAVHMLISTTDTRDGWRGDAARAGGGVLLHGAYEAVDWLLRRLGIPETVHAACALAVESGMPRRYDTEDIAMVTFQFSDDRLAHLTAHRGARQDARLATLVGTNGLVAISANEATITPNEGSEPTARTALNDSPLTRCMESLAVVIRGDGTSTRQGAHYLEALAVIQAAYLSARTNQPESPARYL